jgi:hypothetical protein
MSALIFPKGGYNCAEILAFFVQFKSATFHINVKFHEKLVSNSFKKDIHDYGQRILLSLHHFIELL